MPTRNGKIANLPNDIREQLNLRLLEGETGAVLAAWLNALPEVQSTLGAQFNGVSISEVNLTHWRQGGYLQWLTERECFDSARALAEGDCDLATTGLTAERLLNILTLRFGELLMRWDFSPEEGIPDSAAFAEVARKGRVLQGISRSVLAIHRIQSKSAARENLQTPLKSQPTGTAPATGSESAIVPTTPRTSRGASDHNPQPAIPSPVADANARSEKHATLNPVTAGRKSAIRDPLRRAQGLEPVGELGALSLSKRLAETAQSEIPTVSLSPCESPFNLNADFAEILAAV